jgi:endonuclease IV
VDQEELSCRLDWTLGAEDVAREMMGTPGAFQSIKDVLDRFHKKPEAAPIIETAYGALANLTRVGEHQSLFRESEVIAKATQSIQASHYNEGLYIEACALLGVLTTDAEETEKLVAFDVATLISKLLPHQRF